MPKKKPVRKVKKVAKKARPKKTAPSAPYKATPRKEPVKTAPSEDIFSYLHEPHLPETTQEQKTHFVKSKSHTLTLILLPIITIAFILVLFLQQRQIAILEEHQDALQQELSKVRAENNFYKKAYELTLDDIRIAAQSFGGENAYQELADKLRSQELDTVLDTTETSVKARQLKNPDAWQTFVDQGIISTECLLARQIVDTINDEFLLTLTKQGTGTLSLYIDANFIVEFTQQDTRFTFSLDRGQHAIDFVSTQGDVAITQLLFDTVTIAPENATVDFGSHWEVFNCLDTETGMTLDKPGAIRILVDKE